MIGPSPFTVLEQTFRLLGAEPDPVALDGRRLGHGLPYRQIPILEVRRIVTRPTTASDLQDHIVSEVLGRLSQQPATWVVVLGGLLLPALRCRASDLLACDPRRCAFQVEAELLSGVRWAMGQPSRVAHRFAMKPLLQHPSSAESERLRCRPKPLCYGVGFTPAAAAVRCSGDGGAGCLGRTRQRP
jgi:hypothetical protein